MDKHLFYLVISHIIVIRPPNVSLAIVGFVFIILNSADLFLYSYEVDFVHKEKNQKEANTIL